MIARVQDWYRAGVPDDPFTVRFYIDRCDKRINELQQFIEIEQEFPKTLSDEDMTEIVQEIAEIEKVQRELKNWLRSR